MLRSLVSSEQASRISSIQKSWLKCKNIFTQILLYYHFTFFQHNFFDKYVYKSKPIKWFLFMTHLNILQNSVPTKIKGLLRTDIIQLKLWASFTDFSQSQDITEHNCIILRLNLKHCSLCLICSIPPSLCRDNFNVLFCFIFNNYH